MSTKDYYKICMMVMAAFLVSAIPQSALAITAPTAGSFGYDIYDIGVNQILKGGIGFVAGLGAIVMGSVMAIKQQVLGAAPCILGGGALIKGDALVTSLGCMI